MSQEKSSDADEATLHEQRINSRPAMNWNKANGTGLRTSLRGTRLATLSRIVTSTTSQPHATNPESDSVIPTTTSEPKSAFQSAISSDYESQKFTPINFATEKAAVTMSIGEHGSKTLELGNQTSPQATESGMATHNISGTHVIEIEDIDVGNHIEMATNPVKKIIDHNTQKCQLCISGVPNAITKENIWTLCSGFKITAVEIRHEPKRSDNAIYIHLLDTSESQKIINKINGEEVEGYRLHIDFAPNSETGKISKTLTAICKAELIMTRHESPLSSPKVQIDSNNKPSSTQESDVVAEEGEILGDTDGNELDIKDFLTDRSSSQNSDSHKMADAVVIDSDEDDVMITNYADARQTTRDANISSINNGIEVIDLEAAVGNSQINQQEPRSNSVGPQILAELTIAELELQVRYFYVARDPTTIPETDPVRCLTCAGVGHLESCCPARTCSHCNTKGTHFSKDCPRIARCERCRGLHLFRDCKYKLKPQNLRIVCDLCNEKDHLEGDCELNWRSSGPIWKKALPPLSVKRTCFVCGDSGHLGNDCRLRQPGKPMGSSMWSEKGLPYPMTLLVASVDRNLSIPATAKKKHKMPNTKAKGFSAAPVRSSSNAQLPAVPFDPNKTQGWPELINSARVRKGVPANIQIKGLATRTSLQSRTPMESYPPAQASPPYREYRENQNSNYSRRLSISSSSFDRRYPDEDRGAFIRGRANSNQYRPRSRSRSPRRWYRSPPPATNYGTSSRDYRDRSDINFSGGGNNWRSNGR